MGPNNCSPNPNKDSTLIMWSHKLRSAQKNEIQPPTTKSTFVQPKLISEIHSIRRLSQNPLIIYSLLSCCSGCRPLLNWLIFNCKCYLQRRANWHHTLWGYLQCDQCTCSIRVRLSYVMAAYITITHSSNIYRSRK